MSAAPIAAAPTGVGVIGDSLSDEYADAIPRFEVLGTSSKNWVELMAQSGKANFGAWQTGLPEPRLDGYEFDWARYGASSASAISQGQVSGVVDQVRAGKVSHVVVFVGQNDFSFGGDAYKGIYSGKWTSSQIQAKINDVVTNLRTIIKDVSDAGGKLVVANIVDWGTAPIARITNPNATYRDRVAKVVSDLDQRIATLANQYGAPLVDLYRFSKDSLGTNTHVIRSQTVGGQTFYNRGGIDVRSEFIFDGAHPSTVGQAQLANLFITALNRGYGMTIPVFTEKDIMGLLKLSYKKNTANVAYASYVTLPNTILTVATPDAAQTALTPTSGMASDAAGRARSAALLAVLTERTASPPSVGDPFVLGCEASSSTRHDRAIWSYIYIEV